MTVTLFTRPDEPEWRRYLASPSAQEHLSMTLALEERLKAIRALYPAAAHSDDTELMTHVQLFASQRPAKTWQERQTLMRELFTSGEVPMPGATGQVLTPERGLEHHEVVTNALCRAHPEAFLQSTVLQDPVALEVACEALELPSPRRPLLTTALDTWQHYADVCGKLHAFRLAHELSLAELRLLLVDYPGARQHP